MKKIIWYYLSYPLRLLYKNRISIYRNILFNIETQRRMSATFVKARRVGYTTSNLDKIFFDAYCESYMRNFINKWKLK